jgi:E3 ubiquitin-protein ligase UBR1
LSRVVKVYVEAFVSSITAEVVAAISTVIHHILLVCTTGHDVSEGSVSFHLLTDEHLREIGRSSLREVQAIQTVIDFPLRVKSIFYWP